mgnify:CR=1 FL=1
MPGGTSRVPVRPVGRRSRPGPDTDADAQTRDARRRPGERDQRRQRIRETVAYMRVLRSAIERESDLEIQYLNAFVELARRHSDG